MTGEEKIFKIAGSLGMPELLDQTAEEAAELAQAALKLARILRGKNPTPLTREEAWEHLAEELADVKLCMEVIETGWPNVEAIADEIKAKKMERWLHRLGVEEPDT